MRPYTDKRVRVVPFEIRPGRSAVEDVVGRQVADVRPDVAGSLGDITGAEAVHTIGAVGIGLAGVDSGPGGRVDDDIRLDRPYRGQHGVAIGDVEDAFLGGDDVQRRAAEALPGPAVQLAQDLGAYLAGHSGHEHAHFCPASGLRGGSRPARPG